MKAVLEGYFFKICFLFIVNYSNIPCIKSYDGYFGIKFSSNSNLEVFFDPAISHIFVN